jgi:acylglycerol lipase
MTSTTERRAAADGTSLLVRRWAASGSASAPSNVPFATILLVHGLAEHSGRYEHVGAFFAERAFDMVALDLRGFGATSGRRAWVDRWSDYHDDIQAELLALRSASHRPVAIYGHSMGGLVALGYVVDPRPQPDALVLSAPGLDSSLPGWKRGLAAVLGRVAPGASVANGLEDAHLSSDPRVGRAYRADPLNVHASTAGFGLRAFAEQRRVRASLDRLAVPTLIVHGSDDHIVPTAVSELLDGRPGVTRRVYPAGRHELHNEPDLAPRVLGDVADWLTSTLGYAEGN